MQSNGISRQRKSLVLGLLFTGMILSYFDRIAINIGIIPMGEELGFNPSQTGLLISIFFVGYTIMQPVGGWLTDKFGSRHILTFSILCWSIFTFLTGLGWSLASLLVIRFLFGIGEGGFYPASFRAIHENFSENEYGRANSFFKSAAAIGTALGTGLTAFLVVQFGWRGMFMGIGAIGVFVAWLFWIYLKPPVNQQVKDPQASKVKISYSQLLKVGNIWKLFIANFFFQIVQWGIMSWMPSYLVQAKGLNLKAAGVLLVIPAIASFLMLNVSGLLLDKYFVGKERYLAICGFTLAVTFIFIMFNVASVGLGIFFMTLSTMSLALIGPTIFTIVLKYMPGELVGSATGFVSLSGQIAGAISPAVIGFIIHLFNGSYFVVSCFLSVSALMGLITVFLIKNNKKAEPIPTQEYEKVLV